MAGSSRAALRSLVCADTPQTWARAGFSVGGSSMGRNEVRIGAVRITLSGASVPTAAGPKGITGLTGWTWSGVPQDLAIGGITTAVVEGDEVSEEAVSHENGIVGIDHVVLKTNNLQATREAFEAAGIEMRRERKDIYPGITQCFFRPEGGVIIEVIAPSNPDSPEQPSGFLGDLTEEPKLWGITFVSRDLEATKSFFGDKISKIRKAQQAGRQIATLRTAELGITLAIAVMSPHQSAASSL